MANIIDYVVWRGDLTFECDPLNEVDGAVLSRLTYQRYEYLKSPVIGKSLGDTLREILAIPGIEEKVLYKGDWEFMNAVAGSKRFCNLTVLDYTDTIEDETQFSALTLLDKSTDTLLVFFRGTDNTLVGWKEDFNMAFVTPLPGQIRAKEYLERMSALSPGKIYVGGHSKGGNLALFSSAFASASVQERIGLVFNYDGPGFEESVIKNSGIEKIKNRIRTFVPQSSVVGMLLEHEEDYTIVHSERTFIMQHDIYSWDVTGKSFEVLEEVDGSSRFVDHTLKDWLKKMDKEEREAFVDCIFSVMESGNYSTLREMKENWLTSGMGMLKGIMNLSPEQRKSVTEAFSLLFKSSKLTLLTFRK